MHILSLVKYIFHLKTKTHIISKVYFSFKDKHTHNYIYCHKYIFHLRKEGNVLFNDAVNTFYLWLNHRHMVKDHMGCSF